MKRNWFARHPIGFMTLYFLLYLSAFNFLETQISMPRVLLVHCRLDDLIPFCKYAILPYFAWFAWIPFTLFYLLWKAPREDFWRLCLPLFGGMTIALACYVMVLGFHGRLLSIWMGMFLDWVFRSLCFFVRFARGRWMEQSVI